MTTQRTNETVEGLRKYQFGAVAQLAHKRGSRLEAGVALDNVLSNLGDGHDYQGFLEGAKASPEGIKRASEFYGNLYQEKITQATVGNLMDYLASDGEFSLGDYFSQPESKVLKAKLSPYSEQTLEELGQTQEELKGKMEKILTDGGASEDTIRGINYQLSAVNEAAELILGVMDMNSQGLNSYVAQEASKQQMDSLKERVLGVVRGS